MIELQAIDARLAIDLGNALGARLVAGGVASALLTEATGAGFGRESSTAIIKLLEHLLGQEVRDEPVAAAKGGGGARRARTVAHRQRRELQAGDPALGARLECGNGGLIEREREGPAQEHARLVSREAQVVGAQLDHGAPRAAAPAAGQSRRAWR